MGRRILLLLASTLLSLLAVEAAVRVLFPYVGWRQFEDVGLGWSSAEYQAFDPAADPRREGVQRLLFLGDSFIAGAGLESLDERFPIVLGERLGEGVEVAILASAGWGTDQELLAFVQKGLAWQPDVVFLVFCATNDLANNLSNRQGRGSRKPYFVLGDDAALSLFDTRGDPLDRAARQSQAGARFQSYALDLLRYRLRPADADEPPEGDADMERVDPRYTRFHFEADRPAELWEGTELSWSPEQGVNHVSAYIHEDFETNSYQWALFEGILAELARVTRAGDAELVVMLLPVSFRPRDLRFVVGSAYEQHYTTPDGGFTFRAREPRDRLQPAVERVGAHFYDPSDAFLRALHRRGLKRKAWKHPGDRHFSATAHALIAEQMEEALRSGSVPGA